jgi:predicted glycogen debranching enzyme
MSIHIDREVTQDFERAANIEWLETNGLGGWAGTTVAGAHSRRYHGLLVAATPQERTVLLSRLDEILHLGGDSFELGCNRFPGAVAPQGFQYLTSFRKDLFPVFEYEAGGIRLRKTVAAVDGENTTLVLYEVLDAPGPFLLSLRPFLAARDQHALTAAPVENVENSGPSPAIGFDDGLLRVHTAEEIPEVLVLVPGADFRLNPQWWYRFEYELDRQRGFDFQEDLWMPGLFSRELAPGDRLGVILSTEDPRGRDAFALFEKERKRRERMLKALPVQDGLARSLALAADSFIVRKGANQRMVVAGYPWFGERSRDTMIALPGLCLVTGRFDDAKKILRTFAKALDQGVLPDRLAERGAEPALGSVDASLWFAVAAWKYLQTTGDEDFVRETLLPALRKVVHWYQKGTHHEIRMEEDGLLRAGTPETAVTWMDGRIEGRPVTPRNGKAVEVNALWVNTLRIAAEMEARLGDAADGRVLAQKAKRAEKRFQELFWNEEAGHLHDVVDGEAETGFDGIHSALRPNQIFALSLPFPLLPKAKAARVLETIEAKLYTPVGLRTLSPDHPDYHAAYEGDPDAREAAYHQGTVWSWLLGPYLTALVRVHGAAGRRKAREVIAALEPSLAEAGAGSLSEVFDGEAPHSPRGCIARAWSVAEVLRAYAEDVQTPAKPEKPKKSAVKPSGARSR